MKDSKVKTELITAASVITAAIVTGVLLALTLPSNLPLWMAAIGAFFAVIVVKQFFGGLGGNFLNPAMAGRALIWISWLPIILELPNAPVLFGISENTVLWVKALALFGGGVYLIARKVINWEIPVLFIGIVAVGTLLLGWFNEVLSIDWLLHILSGGLVLGAFFMATDPVTTPMTRLGRIYFGIGCGVLTFILRGWGNAEQSVVFAILVMNVTVPLIDKISMPRKRIRG